MADGFSSYNNYLVLIVITIIGVTATANIDNCGDLSVQEPTIRGRNVTFTFRPNIHYENASLKWERTNKDNPWSTLPEKYKFTQFEQDGSFYLILTDTVARYDEVFYRIQYYMAPISTNCTMETPKLILKDISNYPCGFVYLRTSRIKEGENVEIEYYPNNNVLDYPERYTREWVRSYDSRTSVLTMTGGVYEERAISNDGYVLTIFSFKSRMDGIYAVRCTEAGDYSNILPVILPVPPSQPTIEGLTDIEDCISCVVGEKGEKFDVLCKFSSGTEPVTVSMTIGNDILQPTPYKERGGYVAFFYLDNKHHMAQMKCSVQNVALTSPLTVTARVYVVKPPSRPVSVVPSVLKQGDDVNIICTFNGGRPDPVVYLKWSGQKLSPTKQTNTFNAVDQTYSSVITLDTFQKVWNNEEFSCCRYSAWYKTQRRCYKLKRVEYLFPPTNLTLQIQTGEGNSTTVHAICTIYGSNPICKARWQAPVGAISTDSSIGNASRPNGAWDSKYIVAVNTSEHYSGEKIVCTPDCPDFSPSLEQSVFMPYAPVIKFNIPASSLDIPEGDRAFVLCTAKSSPMSNISWTEQGHVLKQCDLDIECKVAIRGDNFTQRSLFCNVQHLLGSDSKELVVNMIKRKEQVSKDTEGTDGSDNTKWVILGSALGVVAIVVIAGLIWKKTRMDGNTKSPDNSASVRAEENAVRRESNDEVGELACAKNESADITYSQMNKSNTPSCVGQTNSNGGPSSSQPQHQSEGIQLVYADLAFDSPGSEPAHGAAVNHRRDSPTEYVGIDFVKTSEIQAARNESSETENIYANQ